MTYPFWWEDQAPRDQVLRELPARVDAVVVGAGYTGLSAALTLARAGRSVLVLDANKPGEGASTRNGGMLGDRLKPGLSGLTRRCGRPRAIALLQEAREALEFLCEFVRTEQIECCLSRSGSFSGAILPTQYEKMARETEALQKAVGLEAEMISANEVEREVGTTMYVGGRVIPHRGGLHPALYHRGLLDRAIDAGALVAGAVPATGLARGRGEFTVRTPHATVSAGDVLIATNGYTRPVTKWLRRRVIPVTSYMIATETLPAELMRRLMPKGRMLTDTNRLLCYYRPSPDGRRILFGGRPAYTHISSAESARRLLQHLRRVFPELADVAFTHSWYGYIGYSFDTLPHIGVHDGAHYALGYCGSGVVMSTWLGRKAALQILDSPEGRTGFSELKHSTVPFYRGRPWFLPLVQAGYQMADRVGR